MFKLVTGHVETNFKDATKCIIVIILSQDQYKYIEPGSTINYSTVLFTIAKLE